MQPNTPLVIRCLVGLNLIALLAVLGAGTSVQATEGVTWTTGNIVSPADVDTNGTLVMAYNIGDVANAATINGVTFAADPGAGINLTGGGATVSVPLPQLINNGIYGTWNQTGAAASYGLALSSGRYQYNGFGTAVPLDVTISGLIPGTVYRVQFWDADARGGDSFKWQTFSARSNAVTLTNYVGGPQWAIGTFTATGSTEVFRVTPQTPTYGGPQLNLFQLRILATNIPPHITAQPQSQTNWVGNPATFTVAASGSIPLSYQWFVGADAIPGATNAAYTIPSVQMPDSGSTYHVQVSNPVGTTNSNAATLTVHPPIIWITGNIVSPADVDTNGTLVMAYNIGDVANAATINGVTFAADPGAGINLTGGGATVSVPLPQLINNGIYGTWNQTGAAASYGLALSSGRYQYNGFGTAVPLDVTISGLIPGTVYRVQFWDADARGGDSFKWQTFSARSNAVTLTNYVGGPQWAVGTFTATGSTEAFRITPQTPTYGGPQLNLFQLRALTTNRPPDITAQPTNQTATVGSTATFSVTANGTAPLRYQWYFNTNTLLANATNATLTLNNVQLTNAGKYRVVVTNAAGNAGSSNAALTVNRLGQTINFAALPVKRVDAPPFALSASSSSGLPVSYTSSNPDVAAVSGNTVILKGIGSTTITASQAGDALYLPAADVSQPLRVLRAAGTVVAWEYNVDGQCAVPIGLSNVVAVAAGDRHTAALKDNGEVVAWGYVVFGVAVVPPGLSNVTAIAAGRLHTLALKGDGTVVAWGYNGYGQTTIPAGLSNVVAIAAGGDHSVALQGDGTMIAWGKNNYGQRIVPAGLSNVIAIAASYVNTVALKGDGTVMVWGENTYGQNNIPAGLGNVAAIAAGDRHTVALKHNGEVVAWGYNTYGIATVPSGLSNVTAIAAGRLHTLALKGDGTVVAWGYNGYGQTTIPAGLGNVVAVAAGGNHSVAVVSSAPPLPRLTLTLSASNMIMTWPADAAGVTLQYTTNLTSPIFWSPVVPGPVIVNGQHTVSNSVSATRCFFRLIGN